MVTYNNKLLLSATKLGVLVTQQEMTGEPNLAQQRAQNLPHTAPSTELGHMAPHKQPPNIFRSSFLDSFYFPSDLLLQFLPEPRVLAVSVSRPAPPLKSQTPASPR